VTFSGEEYDGQHEAIVDMETFDKCVKKKAINKAHHTKRSSTLLGGLLFCKRCGARYAHWSAGNGHEYYSCYSRRKIMKEMIIDPECKNKNYRAEKLESMVLGEIAKFAKAPEKEVKKRDTSQPIRKELEKIDKQRMRLLDLYALGSYTVDELQSKLQPLMDRKNKLEMQLSTPRTSRADAVSAFRSYRDVVERGNSEELRILVHTLIDKIEIDGDDLYIHWAF
jgi:site-specific DNA recombinase